MTPYHQLQARLQAEPRTWLNTGVAGFICRNLLETLPKLNQRIVGLDNFATGHKRNPDEVQSLVTPEQWANFHFIQGDISNLDDCHRVTHLPPLAQGDACCEAEFQVRKAGRGEGGDKTREATATPVDYILQQVVLCSVPRSIEALSPWSTTNMCRAANADFPLSILT